MEAVSFFSKPKSHTISHKCKSLLLVSSCVRLLCLSLDASRTEVCVRSDTHAHPTCTFSIHNPRPHRKLKNKNTLKLEEIHFCVPKYPSNHFISYPLVTSKHLCRTLVTHNRCNWCGCV